MNKRYVVCPGYITNLETGEKTFISEKDLALFYGVSLQECAVYKPERAWMLSTYKNDIWLYPDHEGKYDLLTRIRAGRKSSTRGKKWQP